MLSPDLGCVPRIQKMTFKEEKKKFPSSRNLRQDHFISFKFQETNQVPLEYRWMEKRNLCGAERDEGKGVT